MFFRQLKNPILICALIAMANSQVPVRLFIQPFPKNTLKTGEYRKIIVKGLDKNGSFVEIPGDSVHLSLLPQEKNNVALLRQNQLLGALPGSGNLIADYNGVKDTLLFSVVPWTYVDTSEIPLVLVLGKEQAVVEIRDPENISEENFSVTEKTDTPPGISPVGNALEIQSDSWDAREAMDIYLPLQKRATGDAELLKIFRKKHSGQAWEWIPESRILNSSVRFSDQFLGTYMLGKDTLQPVIEYFPPDPVQAGISVDLPFRVKDNLSNPKLTLEYQRGISAPRLMELDPAEGENLRIPGQLVQPEGFAYNLQVYDGTHRVKAFSGLLPLSVKGSYIPPNLTAGRKGQFVFSMPVRLSVSDILNSFNSGDIKVPCSVYRFEKGLYRSLNETPAQDVILPGTGMLINCPAGMPKNISFSGIYSSPLDQYAIHLEKGWNLLGNPFLFSISIKDFIKKQSANTSLTGLYSFNSASARWSWPDTSYLLEPGKAYMMYTGDSVPDLILNSGLRMENLHEVTVRPPEPESYDLQIQAVIDSLKSAPLVLLSKEQSYFDQDLPSPPVLGRDIMLRVEDSRQGESVLAAAHPGVFARAWVVQSISEKRGKVDFIMKSKTAKDNAVFIMDLKSGQIFEAGEHFSFLQESDLERFAVFAGKKEFLAHWINISDPGDPLAWARSKTPDAGEGLYINVLGQHYHHYYDHDEYFKRP